MKRMPFERPTDHYDLRIRPIDEQICHLLQQRKAMSDGNPGFPPNEDIEAWAKQFGFYEEFLKGIFASFRNEDHYKPRIQPNEFQKHLPVLQSIEKYGEMFTITYIRQYDNASVIQLNEDHVPLPEDHQPQPQSHSRHRFHELNVGDGYDCRFHSGGGSSYSQHYEFVVSPRLPDNLAGFRFVFREKNGAFGDYTGLEVAFDLG